MNEWLYDYRKKLLIFFAEYGKVVLVITSLTVSFIALSFIGTILVPQKLRVSFLDVGQGDSILIQTPSGHQMLIDGGATNQVLEKIGKELSYFDRDVDVIVATHPDADHVTGLIPILEKYEVSTIVVSPTEGHTQIFDDVAKHIENEQAEMHIAKTGDVIDFHDGVTARILYPSKNYKGKKNDTNDASVSMVVSYGDHTFLLTGDLPSTREPQLLSSGLLQFTKSITVYKAGHHGSKYSSGEQLLTYIKPEYAVISAGKENKYGHPNSETLERLQKYAKNIVSTINRGTISFITNGSFLEMETTK